MSTYLMYYNNHYCEQKKKQHPFTECLKIFDWITTTYPTKKTQVEQGS